MIRSKHSSTTSARLAASAPVSFAVRPSQTTGATALALCFITVTAVCLLTAKATPASAQSDTDNTVEGGFTPLFDGKSFEGWHGDQQIFRIEDGCIVGGSTSEKIPHNFFLSHSTDYADFELRLQFKLVEDDTNAGIQIRSQRIPDHHEMIGYQADLGQKYWGCLYDESRRRRILAGPDLKELEKVLRRNDWNDYRILRQGPRIQLWINDLKTVDYTEADPEIPLTGLIALQIHGGPPGEAWYRNIRIKKIGQ
jgi:hypothetical protein